MTRLAKREGDPPATALLMGWNSIPIRAEKSLYDLAIGCRESPDAGGIPVGHTSSGQIADQLKSSSRPAEVEPHRSGTNSAQRFASHLEQFGHIIFQLDFTEDAAARPPRADAGKYQDVPARRGRQSARAPAGQRSQAHPDRPGRPGRLKGLRRWAFSKALNWAQSLSEVREDALADIGLGYPDPAQMLRELGSRLVDCRRHRSSPTISSGWRRQEIDRPGKPARRLEAWQSASRSAKPTWRKLKAVTPPPMLP